MNTTDDEAVIEIKPGKNTCCPEKTLHVTCIGCGTDYGGIVEYTEKEVRLAEERGYKQGRHDQKYSFISGKGLDDDDITYTD